MTKVKRSNHGFSLIELTIVLCIIVLIVTITLPRLIWNDRMIMLSELNSLYTATLETQHRALVSNTKQVLTINTSNHSYHWLGKSHFLHHAIQFGHLPGAKGPPSSPTVPIHSSCSFQRSQIVCHPDGHIDPGSAYMIGLKSNLMYALCIGVSQVSFVRKYYFNRMWKLV
ncbi:MAG TPA: type II secretion system protein [Candidatus Babeliales bacterium]|nr:type II secretion system protein [Candidatus Babeliales bacterium]